MPKYRVSFAGYITATVTVKTDETDPEVIAELAYDGIPGICAQCSGWGSSHSLELGDAWEVVTDENNVAEVRKQD